MKKRVVVLGCGMVGATMAKDLATDANFDVTVADVSKKNLDKVTDVSGLTTVQADLGTADSIRSMINGFDLVVGAMPSVLGFMTLKTVVESGKPFADISFMVEDMLKLDGLAKQHGTTAVVDCGVAPGLANMIIGHHHAELDRTTDVFFCVGGLPKARRWPYEYKAPFAPSDVLEEYTRPARLVENGKIVEKPALSEPELMNFPRVGTLEAFNTDGLRSLIHTINVPNMKEKTLRYPGHINLMRALRETGLLSKDEVEVGGVKIRPLDMTSKLLFPHWTLDPDEEEFTIMRVIVEGEKDGRAVRHVYDLYDEFDKATRQTSMARTTGFPCVIVARLLAAGAFQKPGVFPPESLGKEPGMLDRMLRELASRGVTLEHRVEEIA